MYTQVWSARRHIITPLKQMNQNRRIDDVITIHKLKVPRNMTKLNS